MVQLLSLDILPDHVILQIVQYLTLRERIRCSRVNRRWRDLCMYLIETRTFVLDLRDKRFWRLNADSLAHLLRSCAANLHTIVLPKLKSRHGGVNTADAAPYARLNVARWCQTLSEFRFANLRELNLGDAAADRACVETILTSSGTTLTTFRWSTPDPNGLDFGAFGQRMHSLQNVDLGCLFAKDSLFASLAGNCPDLRTLTASSYFRQWTAVGLDRMCSACPSLRALRLRVSDSLAGKGQYVVPLLFDPPKLVDDFVHLWSLKHLRHLSLPFEGGLFDDRALERVSLAFPQLRALHLGDSDLTSGGVRTLRRLKYLKDLTLAQCNGPLDDGLCAVAKERRLEKLNIAHTCVDFQTLRTVIRNCPKLNLLNIIRSISNYQVYRGTVVTVEQAVQLIHDRQETGGQNCLTLIHADSHVWTASPIRTAVTCRADTSNLLRIFCIQDFSTGVEESESDSEDEAFET